MKPSILIVDDNEQVLVSLATWLGALFPGCSFFTARSGEEAAEIISDIKPVVVLMDICMPGWSGFTTIREIRRAYEALDVIVLTAHDDNHYRREAEEAGARAYVLKDEAPRKLPTLLKQALCQWIFETTRQA
ncbi:MAG: response regulator transcription factor [Candidatus Hydrogenedentes bacterium]|nr:response regulator transcription factor [Candidatus Hydrogenedentota bacterium]